MRSKFFLTVFSVISATFLVSGFAISYFFTSVDKSWVTLDKSLVVEGNDSGYKIFDTFSNYDYIASFTVVNGTLKSCYPLSEGLFQQWQEGQYEPNWVETNHAEYELVKSSNIPRGYTGAGAVNLFWFVFKNDDSFSKEVHLQVTQFWKETNYAILIVGTALMVTGITGLVLVIGTGIGKPAAMR